MKKIATYIDKLSHKDKTDFQLKLIKILWDLLTILKLLQN